MRASGVELIGINLDNYFNHFKYYPRDIQATFKCSFTKNSKEYFENRSLYIQINVGQDLICTAKDPVTKKPYQYSSFDCNDNKCKGYRLIANFDHAEDPRIKSSQKTCNFGSGSEYIVCNNSSKY